jgi:hypothetical protein
VQLISQKLIAPIAGVMVIPGVVGITTASANSGDSASVPTGSSVGAAAPSTGATLGSLVASRPLQRDVLIDHEVTVAGALESTLGSAPFAGGGQTVLLEQRRRRGWAVVARSSNSIAGPFLVAFRPRRLGVHAIRLQVASSNGVYDTPTTKVNVFHEVLASWYGPGGVTACGQELTATTLGVANKTLPCGTVVTLHYHHRTVRVPVIDRGPFVAGRDYDLTLATKEKLGAGDLTVLWADH